MPTSPTNHGEPVPSTMWPPAIMKSYSGCWAVPQGAKDSNNTTVRMSECVEGFVVMSGPRIPDNTPFHVLNAPAVALSTLVILTSMLDQVLEEGRKRTDAALERLLPAANQRPTSIHNAMRHSVFAGGKRLRPTLCMEAGRAVVGLLPTGIEHLGAALEMLHTYSL